MVFRVREAFVFLALWATFAFNLFWTMGPFAVLQSMVWDVDELLKKKKDDVIVSKKEQLKRAKKRLQFLLVVFPVLILSTSLALLVCASSSFLLPYYSYVLPLYATLASFVGSMVVIIFSLNKEKDRKIHTVSSDNPPHSAVTIATTKPLRSTKIEPWSGMNSRDF